MKPATYQFIAIAVFAIFHCIAPSFEVRGQSLQLVRPNGGERINWYEGAWIEWRGVQESEVVRLEYSPDNGNTWRLITNGATGLRYRWKNLPRVADNKYLVRVSTITHTPSVRTGINRYASPKTDQVWASAQTTDGNFVLAGTRQEDRGFWVAKFRENGDTLWTQSVARDANARVGAVLATDDGGVLVAGGITAFSVFDIRGKGSSDGFLLKIDAQGNLRWAKLYGGQLADEFRSIIASAEGGYTLAGWTLSANGDLTQNKGDRDYWVVKTNPTGDIIWSKSYGSSGNDDAVAIAQTNGSDYIIAGHSNRADGDVPAINGDYDIWLLRLQTNGDIRWSETYGGSGTDLASSATKTDDNSVTVCGYTRSSDGDIAEFRGISDVWVARIYPWGLINTSKTHGGTLEEGASAMVGTRDGGYVLAGYTNSNDGNLAPIKGEMDFFLAKADDQGNVQWHRTVGGRANDFGRTVLQKSNGGYLLCGDSWSSDGDMNANAGGSDVWMVHYSADTTRVNISDVSDGPFEIFDVPTGVDQEDTRAGVGSPCFSMRSVYPNPGSTSITLQVSAAAPSGVTLSIVNTLGQQVKEIETMRVGADASLVIDVSDLANGQYTILARSGSCTTGFGLTIAR